MLDYLLTLNAIFSSQVWESSTSYTFNTIIMNGTTKKTFNTRVQDKDPFVLLHQVKSGLECHLLAESGLTPKTSTN